MKCVTMFLSVLVGFSVASKNISPTQETPDSSYEGSAVGSGKVSQIRRYLESNKPSARGNLRTTSEHFLAFQEEMPPTDQESDRHLQADAAFVTLVNNCGYDAHLAVFYESFNVVYGRGFYFVPGDGGSFTIDHEVSNPDIHVYGVHGDSYEAVWDSVTSEYCFALNDCFSPVNIGSLASDTVRYNLCVDPPPTPNPTTPPPTSPLSPDPTPGPTPNPTPDPTPGPTPNPTPLPTPQPTPSHPPLTPDPSTPPPTSPLSPNPTPEPTPNPTPKPTPGPTPNPTPSPTSQPTPSPTLRPTPQPTPRPTQSPTPQPIQQPRSVKDQWIHEHNLRRTNFFVTRNNQSDTPIQWSDSIATSATNYANKLASIGGCQIQHNYQGDQYGGENLGANWGRTSRTPKEVLTAWYDDEIDRSSFMQKLHATQVVFRSSRYFGCGEATTTLPNGNQCFIQVCRYIAPGNCFPSGQDNWVTDVLSDNAAARCGGPECPKEGCSV